MLKIIILLFSMTTIFAQVKTGSGGIWIENKDNTTVAKPLRKKNKQVNTNINKVLRNIKRAYKSTWLNCYKQKAFKFSSHAQLSESMMKLIIIENSKALKNLSNDNSFKTRCSKESIPSEKKNECKGDSKLRAALKDFLRIDTEMLHSYFLKKEDMKKEEVDDLIEVFEAFLLLNKKDSDE